jgi:hypothetical protein
VTISLLFIKLFVLIRNLSVILVMHDAVFIYACVQEAIGRPRGLMDMASDFESGSCGFESHRGQYFFSLFLQS